VKLIVFDMDGVLIEERSSWRLVHKMYGIDNSDILKEFHEGKIDEKEFFDRDVERMREYGLTRMHIMAAMNRAKYMRGIKNCIETARKIGIVAIISGGAKCIADRIALYGVDFVFANEIEYKNDIPWKGILNVPFHHKNIVLEKLINDTNAGYIIVIGDSKYDVSMFKLSDLSIAFNPSDEVVKEKADIVVKSNDLNHLIHILKKHYQ